MEDEDKYSWDMFYPSGDDPEAQVDKLKSEIIEAAEKKFAKEEKKKKEEE